MLVNIGKTLNSRDSIFKGVIPYSFLLGAQKLHTPTPKRR
jgi:hypothetical protein